MLRNLAQMDGRVRSEVVRYRKTVVKKYRLKIHDFFPIGFILPKLPQSQRSYQSDNSYYPTKPFLKQDESGDNFENNLTKINKIEAKSSNLQKLNAKNKSIYGGNYLKNGADFYVIRPKLS